MSERAREKVDGGIRGVSWDGDGAEDDVTGRERERAGCDGTAARASKELAGTETGWVFSHERGTSRYVMG